MIAIDGPSGAGKSTVAGLISKRLGIPLLDTGAAYRAAAIHCLNRNIDLADQSAIAMAVGKAKVELSGDSPNKVFLNGEEITDQIRTLAIGEAASKISAYPEVRLVMVSLQKRILAQGSRIIEGRDVTTVVAPDADLKIFLTASIEERARRRWRQLQGTDPSLTLQQVVIDVVKRDHRDYTRHDSPLMLAEDAHIIESYGLTPDETVEKILNLLN